jgi:AcrR family transcriptional regulator
MSTKDKLNPRKSAVQGRAKETVKSIVQAAAHILEKTGLDKINTNQIAKKAGVSIGSLYQYFPTKESIFFKLIEVKLDQYYREFEEEVFNKDYDSKEDFLDDTVEKICEIFEKQKKLRLVLFYFIPRGLTPKIQRMENKFQKALVIKLQSFDPSIEHHQVNIKAYVVIHAIIGIIHSTLGENRDFNLKELKLEINQLILNYL